MRPEREKSEYQGIPPDKKMEPVVGFEPTTGCLQNSCSTTELNWRLNKRTILLICDFANE